MSQKKVMRLICNQAKVFCSISEMLFVLDEGDPDLDFGIVSYASS